MGPSPKVFPKQIFVFVHGYKVSFENALRRTAQIAYDLDFDGAAFLFSWPSRDSYFSYASDWQSAEIAVDHLKAFLEKIAAETHATKIHLIAHSMGNVVLLNALEKIKLSAGPQSRLRFAEILLHSPDVDRDRFGQLMRAIYGIGTGTTLYVCTGDRALSISAQFWGVTERAGALASAVKGVETIDVTAAGSSVIGLNHDIYATNPAIFGDMRSVLEFGRHPPDKRSHAFVSTATQDGAYWLYRRDQTDAPAAGAPPVPVPVQANAAPEDQPPPPTALEPNAGDVPMATSSVTTGVRPRRLRRRSCSSPKLRLRRRAPSAQRLSGSLQSQCPSGREQGRGSIRTGTRTPCTKAASQEFDTQCESACEVTCR